MVVAAHRVARDSLARDSDALSPSIHPGTNPQHHLLLMSLSGNETILITFLYFPAFS